MTIARGPIFQLCWVVRDIEAAQQEFTARYGVAKWFTIPNVHFGPQLCELRGAPADYTIRVALGYAGAQQLELIEPKSGTSLYSEHLDRAGPGLHHLTWVPEDYDAALAEAHATVRGNEGDVRLSDPGRVFEPHGPRNGRRLRCDSPMPRR